MHDRIADGESYFISIRTNEKRLMKQAKERMCMTKYRIEKLIIKYKD